jgi:hypothetical protein
MEKHTGGHRFAFAATIFLSAFLLFQVQPLIGKYVLPWFGGSPMVWTVCMVFFQVVLFFGYAYAHLATWWVGPRAQVVLHIVLMSLALLLLPITPDEQWKPDGGGDPTWRILLLLCATIGLPYLLLSSTGPLLQAWYARVNPQRSPYPLYALSNLGSMLALLSYPFVFDPSFAADRQTMIWSCLFAVFVASCAWCGFRVWRGRDAARRPAKVGLTSTGPSAGAPPWSHAVLWFLLAMVPSVMLLATTNQLCMDLAVVPFLWVLPLTMYLLSFILCFHSSRWCSRRIWFSAWWLIVTVTVPVMYRGLGVITSVSIGLQVAVFVALLFSCAMVCHGELVRLKPDPKYLTAFYLILSAGGAAGGLFVGLLAPRIFQTYAELPLGIIGCTVLTLIVLFRDRQSVAGRVGDVWGWRFLVFAALVLTATQVDLFRRQLADVQEIHRNFFGVLRVKVLPDKSLDGEYVCRLLHGRTMHGMQFSDSDKRRLATTYYGEDSGVGIALRNHRADRPRRIGVVGLGVGTLAVYAGLQDRLQFYEINPDVVELAQRFFEFLKLCYCEPEITLGDARLSMENQSPQEYDVLVLDAFSSDAIPIHLLTREALVVYFRHLKPDGILAVHISNVHLDLTPVLAGHAEHFGLEMVVVDSQGNDALGLCSPKWALLSKQAETLRIPELEEFKPPSVERKLHWTDQRSSLIQILKSREC